MSQNPHARPEPHVSDVNVLVVEEFRANGGRVGGMFEGGDLLLLTTVGARSGREHTAPLGYARVGDRLLVVASAGGSDRDPAWYHNLIAHPMVRVELGTEEFGAVAVPMEGEERDRLFTEIVERIPGYGDYQKGTDRMIPVVSLERHYVWGEVTNLADKLVEVHTWLRSQLSHVRSEAEAYLADRGTGTGRPTPLGLSLQLRQHCLAFCESLSFHHDGEEFMFPHMTERNPDLADVVERLKAEHRTVNRLRGELEGLLADLSTADPERFRADLARMTEEMEAHLDYEEAELFPTLAAIPFPPVAPA
ncbi:nitroreductase/quinone reductase family protein [Nocardiopsis sp. EMB25]|uniref:nitroreductase/quinone reductase family protein n=1 Tax=Nocardiopsis TaxID=2013 RepID=UPI0003497CBF|nr:MULTISPECIES: nitroreductase/quinone reductase family protein [Nocardiopsis]MCY9782497.1 nitroreductase/quinone reductase family protein [Nocardiopsis sp. EMB25]